MATLTVGPTSSFATIADAISVSITNDIIQLEPGYGNENALVTVEGLLFDGQQSSTGVSLQLAFGIDTVSLLGNAPIDILDSLGDNTINGNDGDNTITVSSGNDIVRAGNGTDRLIVDYEAATLSIIGSSVNITDGGTHAVTFSRVENFTITTGSGSDTITVADGDNAVSTGDGTDTITAGNGPNLLDGGAGDDIITAGSGVNTIDGGTGNDTIVAGDGGNTVNGGDGDDDITTGAGDDVIVTGVGNDHVTAGGGADVTTANGGLDIIDSGTGNDRLIVDFSGSITDVSGGVTGGSLAGGYDGYFLDRAGTNSVSFLSTENLTVTTGSGADIIATGDGEDVLDGGAGADQLSSGGGNDVILIGLGSDALDGGVDTDSVIFSGARSDYQVSDLGGGVLQTIDLRNGSPDGIDTLQNIEGFYFTDGIFDAVTVLVTPPTTGIFSLAFSADTGASNSDFITNTAAQTISGVLNADLVAGETVEVSLDNGGTWTTATSSVGTSTFSLAGQTLAGSDTLRARVTNSAGDGPAASQAYVLDSSAPGQPATPTLSAASDSGTLGDNITNDTTPAVAGTAEAGSTVTLYDTDGTTVLGSGLANGSGDYSITSTTLTGGTHTLSVKATDTAGNVGIASSGLALTIDASAPGQPATPTLLAAFDSATLGDNITSDTTPTVTGTAEADSTVTLYDTDGTTVLGMGLANGAGDYSITSTILTAGSHTLTVKASDTAGNVGLASSGLALTIDASAPGQPATPTLLAASDSATLGDNITSDTTPTVTGTAEADSTVTLYDTDGTTVLGMGLANGAGDYSITSTTLTGGTHTLTVKAADTAGNVGLASSGLALMIDTSAPGQPAAPTLLAASDSGTVGDNITNVTTPAVAGTAEAGSTVTLYDTDGTTVLGSGFANGSGDYSITSTTLTAGTHTLTVRAADTAGNVGAASPGLTLMIDTSAPGQPAAPMLLAASDSGTLGDNITNDATPTVTGNAEAGSNVTLYDTDGTTVLGTGLANGSGDYSITSTTLTGGTHTLTVKAADTAGNVGLASSGLALMIDTSAPGQPAAPMLLAASDSGTLGDNITNDTTPTVTGTAEAGSTVTLYDTDGTTVLGSADASGGAWSITTIALGEGAHFVSATAMDTAGNQSVPSSGLTFTIDTTPPVEPGVALADDSGASNTDHVTNNSQISYIPSEGGGSLLFKADGAANFSFTAPTFTTEGLHTLQVEQQDAAGNVGPAASLSFTFDSIAPHLNGITADSQCANNTSGSTVHFTLAFDEAVDVTGGTPALTLNNGASALYNAEATAALRDATHLAFDYLVSSRDAATPSLAVTGFDSHGATVDDLAGNHANLTNVTAAFAALTVNEPAGTVIPAFTINGVTRPELHLNTTGQIILDEVATHAAEMYGLRFLYLGVPESTPYPPVADIPHVCDCHLM
jgi:Ca2+-binding RTX toxin-like protein